MFKNKTKFLHKKMLSFIRMSLKRRGFPPTIRELTDSLGFSSTGTAHYHLKILMKTGKLKFRYKKIKRSARGIKIR